MPLKSFIDILPDSHFPLENLPFGIFKPRNDAARVGVALGEYVVDLSVLQEAGHFPDLQDRQIFACDSLNQFLALGRPARPIVGARCARRAVRLHLASGASG